MDEQETKVNTVEEDGVGESQKYFQISEQYDHLNPTERVFLIKINITNQMRERMISLQKSKKERLYKLEQRQKTPQYQILKQKYQAFTKMDNKAKEEQRKRNQHLSKQLNDYELVQQGKDKYNFPIFQPFQMRGKSPHFKYFYSAQKKYLAIKISKTFFLQQLHYSHKDLFNTAISFTRTWDIDFYGMVKVLWKLYTQFQKAHNFSIYIKSLDMISVTFDIVYSDKRIYRFRYSPFQFKMIPNFKEDNQLTGYYQSLSCIPELNSIKIGVVDQEFYNNYRLFIFDDLTDSNLFFKLFNRTNIFYQVYSISRGNTGIYLNSSDSDDFAKKCLGHFYFSTTRLKKFIFTWSFKQHKKVISRDRKPKEEEPKQVILHIPFYFDNFREAKQQQLIQNNYRLRLQILQSGGKMISWSVKDEIYFRIREWYSLFKDVVPGRDKERDKDRNAYDVYDKGNKRREDRGADSREDDFQINIIFNSRQRIDKFFVGLILIVSTVLDRNYFSLGEDMTRRREERKEVVIETGETIYFNRKLQYMRHFHWLRVTLVHTYLPQMLNSLIKLQQKTALQSYLANGNKSNEFRLKCGEWKLTKIQKMKRKFNIKNDKQNNPAVYQQNDVTTYWDQIYRGYIDILLKHFPLRVIHRDILHFLQQIAKTCYSGQEDNNSFETNKNELMFRSAINALLNYFYYSQSKDRKQQKQDVKDDNYSRVIIFKILNKDDIGFMAQDKLIVEITFRVMEFRSVWHTWMKEGYIVMRIFEDRVDLEKEYSTVFSHPIKDNPKSDKKGAKIEQQWLKMGLDLCMKDFKASLTL